MRPASAAGLDALLDVTSKAMWSKVLLHQQSSSSNPSGDKPSPQLDTLFLHTAEVRHCNRTVRLISMVTCMKLTLFHRGCATSHLCENVLEYHKQEAVIHADCQRNNQITEPRNRHRLVGKFLASAVDSQQCMVERLPNSWVSSSRTLMAQTIH